MTPPAPWLVISTGIFIAGVILTAGFDAIPAWVQIPLMVNDAIAGGGLGIWVVKRHFARSRR